MAIFSPPALALQVIRVTSGMKTVVLTGVQSAVVLFPLARIGRNGNRGQRDAHSPDGVSKSIAV
jgi:hypothetical protein